MIWYLRRAHCCRGGALFHRGAHGSLIKRVCPVDTRWALGQCIFESMRTSGMTLACEKDKTLRNTK